LNKRKKNWMFPFTSLSAISFPRVPTRL
jgi:hypothetical protein